MAKRVRVLTAGSSILLLALAGSTTVIWAQGVPGPAATVTAAAASSATAAPVPPSAAVDLEPGAVRLMVGRSAVLNVGSAITRVSLTSADIADAMVTAPGQLLVNGKLPGTISMFVWDKSGALKRYEVIVQRDLAQLADQMRQLFPNEHISVQSNGRNVVLAGLVTTKDVAEKAISVASGYVDKKDDVVTLLQVQNAPPTTQVLLRVRFAEVSRSAMTDLGASIFTSPLGIENNIGRVSTQQYPAPAFEDLQSTKTGDGWQKFGSDVTSAQGKLSFSDFLNFFLFNEKYDLGITIKALQSKGLFQSLAEPNLVAESGKDASFLAGGEFPIPVAQGSGANLAINVVFKEFGIRLNFTPTVTGDRIHLKVKPEVSSLDFNNAVVLQGFRIPALSTRRTETELELRNGQTFAISGLMNNTVASTLAKVPGIGDIPVLGYLFKSKAAQKNQTELVVMITPEILANGSRGVTPNLPRGTEPFLPPLPENTLAPPQPEAFDRARRGLATPSATPTGRRAGVQPEPAPAPSAAQAAATVSALMPSSTRQVIEPAAASAAPPAAIGDRQMSEAEKRTLERAKKADEEHERATARAEARVQAEERKQRAAQAAAQAAADRKAAALRKARDAQAAREQARKDAELQKKSEEEARRELRRQLDQQRAMNEAAARLKAAQDRYDAVARPAKP
ncbi:MAG TPA: pilus assembly protein N-terminal domain-containing protein [Vicinamibacterales bacterium]|nr:pilus assembly protein N-terminal domain-containing protein [Vicinamibacterales bacterium]